MHPVLFWCFQLLRNHFFLRQVLGWAKGEESEDELNIQLMEAQRQALMQPEQVGTNPAISNISA